MRIAFYAPLKSPLHPVPSGDRQMARLLMAALKLAGHGVELVSEFRSFQTAADEEIETAIKREAALEVERLKEAVADGGPPPDLWLTYHLYYRAPDYLGPIMSKKWKIPYVVAEASYSRRRDREGWVSQQKTVRSAVMHAARVLCFTQRDLLGLRENIPEARCEAISPFIDPLPFDEGRRPDPSALLTVAMMRLGDKWRSFQMLAAALERVVRPDWRLTVVGGGPLEAEVKKLFERFGKRVRWLGEVETDQIRAIMARHGTYVWPGCGEAFGLAYLEAQSVGLPVIAQDTAGVSEVVQSGISGYLTAEDDIADFAATIEKMLSDPARHRALSRSAAEYVREKHSLPAAAHRLNAILNDCLMKDR